MHAGNPNLCGPPLDNPCPTFLNAPMDSLSSEVFRILLMLALILLIIVVIISAIVIARMRARQRVTGESVSKFRSELPEKYAPPLYSKAKTIDHDIESTKQQNNNNHQHISPSSSMIPPKKGESKLIFLKNQERNFDMEDLLKASAEVLGSAEFGSSYKALMNDDETVVVKRYKHMNNVSRDEFFEHMRRIGDLSHPNLLPLVGFYYRKEEKLLLTDYIPNGCLASQLHGNVFLLLVLLVTTSILFKQ